MRTPDEQPGTRPRTPAQLGWPLLIVLHLAPGVVFWGAFQVLARVMAERGGTAYLALILSIPLCLVPLQLGIMLYWSKRTTGTVSLRSVTEYRGRPGVQDNLVIPVLLLLFLILISAGTGPLTVCLEGQIAGISEGLKSGVLLAQLADVSPNQRALTLILAAVFSGLAAPIIEEVYFRGFLLPRMEFLGWAAPILNAFLFALYHFYLPWSVPAILVMWIPIAIVVRRRKNYVIGIIVHSAINLLGVAQLLLM